jgi:nicotinate-nucleotide adenylyltransferase
MAPFEDRMEMCRRAMAHLGGNVEISDIESEREGPSYTIDTLRELLAGNPNGRFRLIIGSDILDETEQWKNFEEIKKIAPLLVVPRSSDGNTGASFSLPDVSSSAIREALSKGKNCSSVVPRTVLEWIIERGLY